MQTLSLDTVNVPEVIKNSLKSLESQVTFEKASIKGANGYLFFRKDRGHILNNKY
jgi:hypothetical protein